MTTLHADNHVGMSEHQCTCVLAFRHSLDNVLESAAHAGTLHRAKQVPFQLNRARWDEALNLHVPVIGLLPCTCTTGGVAVKFALPLPLPMAVPAASPLPAAPSMSAVLALVYSAPVDSPFPIHKA